MKLSRFFRVTATSCLTALILPSLGRIHVGSASKGFADAANRQIAHKKALRSFFKSHNEAHAYNANRQSTMHFSDSRTNNFLVNGSALPLVNFDAGPSWSGLLPISGDPDETRQLFFWFWPTTNASNVNDLIFWTNGGPGCSSLEGFLQENGPISWSWGQAEPTPNPFSWTNLANVIWVEQPVGTGFTRGVPDITNDNELAAQVVGFLQQFLDIFKELKGSNFYVTGESYGGFYVPYIANYIYENPGVLDLDLQGIWISDPTVSWDLIQQEIPALRFIQSHPSLFPFNQTFQAHLQNISDTCGYTDYLDSVTYPPTGLLPIPVGATKHKGTGTIVALNSCKIHGLIQSAASRINPAFNIYRVSDTWPKLWSVLGPPQSTQEFIYFNRTDVQDAIHAPRIVWEACTSHAVYSNGTTGFPGQDTSIHSMLSVIPNVIEKSVRTVVVQGLGDFAVIAEGTRTAIQNMTWHDLQGFQTPIEPDSFIVDKTGAIGSTHSERGLTYVEFAFSGHMTPQFVPWAAYQTVELLLGQRLSPSATGTQQLSFTLQSP